ncbi:anti-sigma factor family protein [Mycolicibacterium phlei]
MTVFDITPTDDDRYATWDAAYVLGALSGDERREYENHLRNCARCRSAVAELSDIPALLSAVQPEVFLDEEPGAGPPPELLGTLLEKVRTRRTRSRWIASAAVTVAAAALAIGLVIAVRPDAFGLGTQPPPQATAQQLEMHKVSETPINASVALSEHSWGTRIDMACSYGDWGQSGTQPQNLAMVVVGHDGSRNQVATWLGLSGATALPSATTPMRMHEIAAVQLVSPDTGKVLLERPV